MRIFFHGFILFYSFNFRHGNTYNTDPAETEKWDLNTLESHIINPIMDFSSGMFTVPFEYCSRN